jgi:DedD protein
MAEANSTKQTAVDPALPEKKRGRRRLIGAAAFLAGAAVLLSLLFDHEPKPPTPELALKIPPKEKIIAEPTAPTPPVPPAVAMVPAPTPTQATAPGPAPVSKPAPAPEAKVTDAPVVKPEAPKPKAKVPAATEDPFAKLATPKALASGQGGFVVQIGAFSSSEKLDAAVAKAKEAGFKVNTEKVKTVNGQRTRVRVGPFKDKESANAAREQLKAVGLEPAVIAL